MRCFQAAVLVLAALQFVCVVQADFYRDTLHFALDVKQAQADVRGAFEAWARHAGRTYAAGEQEFEERLAVWRNTLRHILDSGANGSAAVVPVNGLADVTVDEFSRAYLGQRTPGQPRYEAGKAYRYENVVPPPLVDWREKDVVGPVKNQHVNNTACGCCWAFATTGGVECIVAMATGKVLSLSEQQLIACDSGPPFYDIGCEGGDFEGGILYIAENGIDTEEDYPYLAQDTQCNKRKERRRAAHVDGFEAVPPANETALLQAVSQHPVIVAVCCGPYIDQWHAYTGGIFDIPGADIPGGCTSPLDHAMVVVGYGTTEEGQDYWLIKNSWNTMWGENGYARMPRNTGGKGAFGLASSPGYAVKKGVNSAADPFVNFETWTRPAVEEGESLRLSALAAATF